MLGEEDYRQASFLDQRILTSDKPREWLPWTDLAGFAGSLPDRADFIFHIGHVGSTLISRLLGELPQVLALREPLLLRTFAELFPVRERPDALWPPETFLPRLQTALGWLSRSFRSPQRPVIKATSFVSELAPALLRPGRKALFLYVSPETYIETILGGEASRQELAVLSGPRLTRLHRRIGEEPWRLWQLGPGERAALAWACEMAALQQASETCSSADILWMDFDAFLRNPGLLLLRAAEHFGQTVSAEAAAALASGPIMGRYSKAPEHGYSPALRSEVLLAARSAYAEEIRAGLQWLEAATVRYPLIARAVSRADVKG
jgi:hypothetical protein